MEVMDPGMRKMKSQSLVGTKLLFSTRHLIPLPCPRYHLAYSPGKKNVKRLERLKTQDSNGICNCHFINAVYHFRIIHSYFI